MLLVPLLGLTACAGSTPSVDGLNIQRPPASLMQACRGPVVLPERVLTQAQVENYWLTDRRSLAECRSRHAGLAQHYSGILETLTGR